MEADVPSPPSPRSDDHSSSGWSWTLVDRAEGVPEALDIRPRASSPGPEHAAEPSAEQEELQDGMKSPASERLADDVLREPFQAGGPLQLQVAAPPPGPTVEEPSTPTTGGGPHAASRGDLTLTLTHFHHHQRREPPILLPNDAVDLTDGCCCLAGGDCGGGSATCGSGAGTGGGGWAFERHHRERLRAMSRLSGEGALEGFQDPHDLLFADSAAPGAAAQIGGCAAELPSGHGGACPRHHHHRQQHLNPAYVTLGWDGLLSGVWSDLVRELEDLRSLLALTAAALGERVREGRLAVEDWAAAVRESARKAAKSMGRPGRCPMWTLLGVSGLAAVTLTALAAQMVANRRLALQLRQRDKDLARLVVKILNLQDALTAASRALAPAGHHLMRHHAGAATTATLERFTATTTLIGMV